MKIYVNLVGADEALPDDAAVYARSILERIGEGQVSPLWAINLIAKSARGEVDVSIEWHFAAGRSIGAVIRIDKDRVCHVIEGGIGCDTSSVADASEFDGATLVAVAAIGLYDLDYGPRSILRWLANVVEPSVPPEPTTEAPDPGRGEDDGGVERGPRGGRGEWYADQLRRGGADE